MSNDFYDTPAPEHSVRLRHDDRGVGTHEPARTNYFSIVWVKRGKGCVAIDDMHLDYEDAQLIFVTPYQYVRLEVTEETTLSIVDFHANFLCVETFHHEVGCSGVLFNDPYNPPKIELAPKEQAVVQLHYDVIEGELKLKELAYLEASLASLKLLLIFASRCKLNAAGHSSRSGAVPVTLEKFSELVENNYTRWHAPAEYAAALEITPKTLGRLTKQHMGTTPTELIRRRILVHAKWQLLHTLKPVKDVAKEVGFQDELYFSRLFRKSVGVSPTYFREFETRIREGRNLSMPLE